MSRCLVPDNRGHLMYLHRQKPVFPFVTQPSPLVKSASEARNRPNSKGQVGPICHRVRRNPQWPGPHRLSIKATASLSALPVEHSQRWEKGRSFGEKTLPTLLFRSAEKKRFCYKLPAAPGGVLNFCATSSSCNLNARHRAQQVTRSRTHNGDKHDNLPTPCLLRVE